MKKLIYLSLSLLALSLPACSWDDVTSVDIDKYSKTGQCIIGCLETHNELPPEDQGEPPSEIRIVE